MKIFVEFGGVRFRFDSDCDIIVEKIMAPFFFADDGVTDVNVRLIHDFSRAPLPTGPRVGEDLLLEYYREGDRLTCLTKGSAGRVVACCVYDGQYRDMTCWLNFPVGSPADSLGSVLRMLPLRRTLLMRGVLFLHASQVALGDTGVLFTAPSGTGKTTQARLWKRFREAQILCNDRTLTDGRRTWGFPMDGSEPVRSAERRKLGAVVILEQAPENRLRRLGPREAIPRLMSQLVLDVWDPEAQAMACGLLLELMKCKPVYLLACTADEAAVRCLEQGFISDGVIANV